MVGPRPAYPPVFHDEQTRRDLCHWSRSVIEMGKRCSLSARIARGAEHLDREQLDAGTDGRRLVLPLRLLCGAAHAAQCNRNEKASGAIREAHCAIVSAERTTMHEPKPDPMIARDLIGYGEFPPNPAWPGGALIAVNFNLNIEGGGELSLANGDDVSEGMLKIGRAHV